jgi:hypothetical protein
MNYHEYSWNRYYDQHYSDDETLKIIIEHILWFLKQGIYVIATSTKNHFVTLKTSLSAISCSKLAWRGLDHHLLIMMEMF